MVDFGIVVWKTLDLQHYTYEVIKRLAIEGERLGFEYFGLADHFQALTDREYYYECYTTLSAIAALTERIRLGPLVTCVSYRAPSLVAKMASTLDVVSGGRLEFALGAGWDVAEYTAYGFPFPPASERVEQVEEALQIIRRMWTEAETSFEGKHFTVEKAVNEPKPFQRPHPRVWLGARHSNMLRLTAEYADGWNIDTAFTPTIFKRKLTILTECCKGIGRDVSQIRKSIANEVIIAETEAEVNAIVRGYSARFNIKPEDCIAHRIAGTPEQITAKLQKYVNLGVDLVICHFIGGHTLKPIELFSEKVMPNIS